MGLVSSHGNGQYFGLQDPECAMEEDCSNYRRHETRNLTHRHQAGLSWGMVSIGVDDDQQSLVQRGSSAAAVS